MTAEEQQERLAALRAGDAAAFERLVADYQPMLLRFARTVLGDAAVAEEAVQETWEAVVRHLDGFRGDSALRTWVITILINTARRRGAREARSVPFSALATDERPVPDPDRFHSDGPYEGHWRAGPARWAASAEDAAMARELRGVAMAAIAELDLPQRAVVVLRDVEGLSGPEAADALGITPGHQRVLLHRGRARVQQALERYFTAGP